MTEERHYCHACKMFIDNPGDHINAEHGGDMMFREGLIKFEEDWIEWIPAGKELVV